MKHAIALILLAVACASAGIAERAAEPVATLTVTNRRFGDAAVWILHSGTKGRRLDGYVDGNSSRTFALSTGDLTHGSLQLLAKYVAEGPMLTSDEVPSVPGAHYTWDLGPASTMQFLWQRSASADGTTVVRHAAE